MTENATSIPRVPAEGLLKDHAYAELKRRIINDEYPPGSFLAERKLAADLGMSKTPVKAALERLELEGFVTVSPQQGIVVREFSVREIADLYEIRIALESHAMRILAGRLTATQIERLRANLEALKRISGSDDVLAAVAIDAEFHFLFVNFVNNQEILRVMEHLRQKMHRMISRVFHLNPGRIDTSYEEHLAIVNALREGDSSAAVRFIENHLVRGKQLILERGKT